LQFRWQVMNEERTLKCDYDKRNTNIIFWERHAVADNQIMVVTIKLSKWWLQLNQIRVITKLPNSKQSSKWKVKTHKYINRQNQSTTGKLWKP
jgi:hypothetical protein